MARTRSKPAAKGKEESTPEAIVSTTKPLPSSVANPPNLFVLPKDTSKDARIITLTNPANGEPSRYLFCPDRGFYEFTRIAAPSKSCQSWMITQKSSDISKTTGEVSEKEGETAIGGGYVTKTAHLFIASPIDLLFLVLPALAPKNAKETKQHFLAIDDHLDALASTSRQWKILLAQYPTLHATIEQRIAAACDTVEAGDETMYRLSQSKLLSVLLKKAERTCRNGLPPSMEEKFIKTALEVPVMSLRREESSLSIVSEIPTTSDATPSTSTESQLSTTTSLHSQTSIESTASTTATSVKTVEEVIAKPSLDTPPEIPHLLRLKTALSYLLSSYLQPILRTSVQESIKSCTTPSFTALDEHLSAIVKLRAEAAALRSISDNITRKRGFEDDDERAADREEKRRKKEEEDKKKKMESRSIKQLKKADTSGMKKLSAFFTKAPKKA